MNDLIKELQTAQQLVGFLQAKKTLLAEREASVAAREKAVEQKEIDLGPRVDVKKATEEAEAMVAKAKADLAEARKTLAQVEAKQADLDTKEATQLERVNAAKHEAQILVDQADQVRKDKVQLAEDRKNYKAQVMKEIQDQFKVGKI
jgi:hypothetical protein